MVLLLCDMMKIIQLMSPTVSRGLNHTAFSWHDHASHLRTAKLSMLMVRWESRPNALYTRQGKFQI